MKKPTEGQGRRGDPAKGGHPHRRRGVGGLGEQLQKEAAAAAVLEGGGEARKGEEGGREGVRKAERRERAGRSIADWEGEK